MLNQIKIFILLLWTAPLLTAEESQENTFHKWDKDQNGLLTRKEVPQKMLRFFSRKDKDNDGKITLKEYLAPLKENQNRRESNAATPRDLKLIKIKQTWHQEPKGFDRQAFVRVSENVVGKVPLVLFFHGNGGEAKRAINQWRHLNSTVLVAAQGYERSWNIFGEKSEAPDVDFVSKLIQLIGKEFPIADLDDVTVIGSSNGAGLINRLMIDMDKKPFQRAILLSSSLVAQQYHDQKFWTSADERNTYKIEKKPTPGPEIIYFHGSNDKVVPYQGGLRGKKFPHVSAQDTTYAWAKAFGYKGAKIKESKAISVEKGILRFHYPAARVTHYKLIGAGHGPRPYDSQVRQIIRDAILNPPTRDRKS